MTEAAIQYLLIQLSLSVLSSFQILFVEMLCCICSSKLVMYAERLYMASY